MIPRLLALALVATALPAFAAPVPPALTTVAERSDFLRTGRHEEVVALCAAFAERHPRRVRCTEFGRTPEGRPLLALVAAHDDAFSPAASRERGRPVLLVQGGIHAGEIDGKDAGFLTLRELLDGAIARGALDALTLVFVPVFNVDGHERFGAWNRPNQRGPEQMGWRTTAQNYNLNRDYVKADSPEMRAMLGLIESWDPIILADLHVTNGAQFEHDISINVEPLHSGDPELRKAGRVLRDGLLARLAKSGSLPLPFYPSFVKHDDPASGFADGVPPPRFSHGYMPLRNRFGVLVETHSWKDYKERVRSTRNTIVALLELTAAHGARWQREAREADARAASLGGQSVALSHQASDRSRLIDFRGYAYTRTPSEISGALMTRYDERTPQIWKIPLRDDVQPLLTATAPGGGYIVPAAHAEQVAARLRVHGIVCSTVTGPRESVDVEMFRAAKTTFATRPVEGHMTLTVEGQWQAGRRDVEAGSLFVPIAQAKARLVVAMFEPQAPDSLAAWGDFNGAFEQKEYMEAYVAEAVARTMMKDDPALAAEFARRLDSDAAFAADPDARLAFFAERHSSHDERYNLYPVLRVARALPDTDTGTGAR